MPTGLITVSQYNVVPSLQLSADDVLEVRGWYTRDFIGGDGVSVVEGNFTNGEQGPYYSITPTLVAGGLTVPAHEIQATTLSNPTGNYIEQLWVNGALANVLMPNTQVATGWQIPTVYGDPISFDEIAYYNRARRLVYPPATYFTATETIREIERIAGLLNYAGFNILGRTQLSRAPDVASVPVAWGTNDLHQPSITTPTYYISQFATFVTALTFIGVDQATLVIDKLTAVGTSSVSIPATMELRFEGTGGLTLTNGRTLTILSDISNYPRRKIFFNATAGQGTVSLTGNKVTLFLSPEWWGAINDSSTNNFAPVQAAEIARAQVSGYLCFTSAGAASSYNTGSAIQITEVKGGGWIGTGPDNVRITATGGTSAVQTNGCWRMNFENLYFTTSVTISGAAVFELDGNYDGVHTQTVQGNKFHNCIFAAAELAPWAFAHTRLGSSGAQGDSDVFYGCYFSGATTACYYQVGFNSLVVSMFKPDCQGYTTHGIFLEAGSVELFAPSFQSTKGYTQIANGGWDIDCSTSGVFERIVVIAGRTESLRFYHGAASQTAVLIGNQQIPGTYTVAGSGDGQSYAWAANTAYLTNKMVQKAVVTGGLSVNKLFRVTTPGTSGGVEPTWPASGTVVDNGITWTQTDFNVVETSEAQLSANRWAVGSVSNSTIPDIPTLELSASTTLVWGGESVIVVLVDATGGNRTITLPTATAKGVMYIIKKADVSVNTVTVQGGPNAIDTPTVIPGSSRGFVSLVNIGGGALTGAFYIVSKSY